MQIMELIDREDHQKLYLQLYEILKKKIETNEWPLSSQIPTEEDMCKMFNVSRVTVRSAILELVRRGYLKRQQGKGTFIFKNTPSTGLTMLTSFKEIMLDDEASYSVNILARTVMTPTEDLKKKFDITAHEHIISIKRLWLLDDEPVVLQETYVPYHVSPLLLDDNVGEHFLLDLFEKKYWIKITKVRSAIDLILLNSNEARLLRLQEGSAAIILTQHFFSGETLFMYSRSIKKPDRSKFVIEFERNVA
jgi:DNA-binding GntR family transcriptional regulator